MKNLVLVAHEDEARQQELVLALEKSGYTCLTATSGSEALAIVASYGPQLVIVTPNLPDIPGADVCLRLKQDSTGPALAVIMIAEQESEGERFITEQVGIDLYVANPDIGRLVDTIKEMYRVHSLNAQPLTRT